MKKMALVTLPLAFVAVLALWTSDSPPARAAVAATRSAAAQQPPPGHVMGGMECPMCGMGMGMGMGMMGHGVMMAPLLDPRTQIKAQPTADGVTITLTNPDRTVAQQLQRMAQIMVLRQEMIRTQMQQAQGQ